MTMLLSNTSLEKEEENCGLQVCRVHLMMQTTLEHPGSAREKIVDTWDIGSYMTIESFSAPTSVTAYATASPTNWGPKVRDNNSSSENSMPGLSKPSTYLALAT